jgi:hypothetical protein
MGRELREGCIIPQIGGGICQLSNAIYDAALKAGLEVVERHGHSQVIKGSLAELGRDATVFWNYIDLRLRGAQDWQLQAKMERNRLIVSIFCRDLNTVRNETQTPCDPAALGDCSQCKRTDCYLEAGNLRNHAFKTYLSLDEDWIEFAEWRKKHINKEDRLISTTENSSLGTRALNFRSKLKRRYYLWLGSKELKHAGERCKKDGKYVYNWRKYPIPVAHNARYQLVAKHFARKLKASDTHLVIPQPLLVWLYLEGELAGRTYDVMMSALPMPIIERSLDEAMDRYGFRIDGGYYEATNPDNPCGENGVTLGDFRAPTALIEAEKAALSGASQLISPHVKILEWAGERGVRLDWKLPQPIVSQTENSPLFRILLAGSSLGRKGIFDLRAALLKQDAPYQLLLIPSAIESNDFWNGIPVRYVSNLREGLSLCDAVILPAIVEHNPRGLLLAIASQKPVIASDSCGLPDHLAWQQANDAATLERLLKTIITSTENFNKQDIKK